MYGIKDAVLHRKETKTVKVFHLCSATSRIFRLCDAVLHRHGQAFNLGRSPFPQSRTLACSHTVMRSRNLAFYWSPPR